MPIGNPINPNFSTINEIDSKTSDHPMLGNIGHFVTVEYFIGSPLQFKNESYFLPNTMTSYFSVNGINCTKCADWDDKLSLYNRTNSTTAYFDTEIDYMVNYGKFEAKGYRGTDRVCWKDNDDDCIKNVTIVDIQEYSPSDFTPPIDKHFGGFFGLNPIDTGLGWSNAPSMIERMFTDHIIDRRQATLWYRYKHKGSGLIFGDHSMDYYKDKKTHNFTLSSTSPFTDLQPNPIWTLNLSDTLFNNKTVHKTGVKVALIDTDQPTIWVPKSDFEEIANKLSKIDDITCTDTYCASTKKKCDKICSKVNKDDWKWKEDNWIGNLTFVINDTWFNLPCEAFTESGTNDTDIKCDIKIDGSHDEYRFGIPFLESFTTTFNYQ